MDTKKRTKAIKQKLSDLGYEVKHTHCLEVLAAAMGLRNSHELQSKADQAAEKNVEALFKALGIGSSLYATVALFPNTTDDHYSGLVQGSKLFISAEDMVKIYDFKKIIDGNKGVSVKTSLGKVTLFEGFNEDLFKTPVKELDIDQDNYPLQSGDVEENLREAGEIISESFYRDNNTYDYTGKYDSELYICEEGIYLNVHVSDKRRETVYYSSLILWKNIK